MIDQNAVRQWEKANRWTLATHPSTSTCQIPIPPPQCHHARDRECRDDGLADHDGSGNGNAVQRGWSSSSIMPIRHASALVRYRHQSAGSSNATAHRKNASPASVSASLVFETVEWL